VVWYTGQFYTLFFLTITLKVGYLPAYLLILTSLIIGTPFYVLFGWLSDHIGRLKIILAGCLMAALTYFALFAALTHYTNPDLEAFAERNQVVIAAEASTCRLHVFVTAFTKFSNCDRAQDLVTKPSDRWVGDGGCTDRRGLGLSGSNRLSGGLGEGSSQDHSC
jgi:hypothetical protein